MTFEIGLLLGLVILAAIFFSMDWVSADVVGLGLLLALTLTGLLSPQRAFAGFGSETVIMIIGLLIMTAALLKAGVVDIVGRFILRRVGRKVNLLLLAITITVATLSAFISNTAAAAFFIPVAIGIAAKSGVPPSRLLMPVAFAAILSSSVSLISTSTNLVVSGLMTTAGLEPMGMFELAPVGIPIAVAGLIYMQVVGRRLMPERAAPDGLIEDFGIRSYLTEVLILPKSSLVGKTLSQSGLGHDLDLNVLRIVRNKDQYLLPRADMELKAGDVVLVEGAKDEVLKVKDVVGIEIRPDVKLSDPNLRSEETSLVEALIVPASPIIGRTLRASQFRERYGLQVLGLNRHGKNVLAKLSRVRLRVGDVMLIQGRKSNIAGFKDEGVFSVLGEIEERRPDRMRALGTGLIFFSVLALATFKWVSLPVAMLLGAFLTFATRCVAPADAYREVEWRAVILIASMLALGEAMSVTGTARYLAGLVAAGSAGLHPVWLLAGFFLLTVLLTQPMSNQAAVAVVLPIAVQTAGQLDLNPRTFAMMIAVAASCSYLTPLEPACLMAYGPGRYRFFDFLRVGGPLVVLLFSIALWIVPRVWPLVPIQP